MIDWGWKCFSVEANSCKMNNFSLGQTWALWWFKVVSDCARRTNLFLMFSRTTLSRPNTSFPPPTWGPSPCSSKPFTSAYLLWLVPSSVIFHQLWSALPLTITCSVLLTNLVPGLHHLMIPLLTLLLLLLTSMIASIRQNIINNPFHLRICFLLHGQLSLSSLRPFALFSHWHGTH